MKKNYILSPVLILLSIVVLQFTNGCTYQSEESNITFFGGKIKNPKDGYVYFKKDGINIDTAKIDSNYKFSFYLDSIELGLYTFHHGDEYQILYLEPKDSLLIYLNTWDFDESLIFSGTQAKKNNYLINLWLEQEKFEKNFKHNYRLNEPEFNKVIDKELNNRLETYNNLLMSEEEDPSEFFDKLAKTGINYPFYYLKNCYANQHKRVLHLDQLPELSDDFYNYRETVDLNDEKLWVFGPYRSYVMYYLYNKAYDQCIDDTNNRNFALNYMKIVNQEFSLEDRKNKLMAGAIWRELRNNKTNDELFKEVEDYFYINCSDEYLIEEFKIAQNQKEQFKKGDKLPNVIVHDINSKELIINDKLKNSNTVIYFWPKDPLYIILLEEKLVKLKKKYPDLVFIGIEINKNKNDWVKFIESKKISPENQFHIPKNSTNYSHFKGDMDRTILVDKGGLVYNGYLHFLDKSLDYQLKSFKKH